MRFSSPEFKKIGITLTAGMLVWSLAVGCAKRNESQVSSPIPTPTRVDGGGWGSNGPDADVGMTGLPEGLTFEEGGEKVQPLREFIPISIDDGTRWEEDQTQNMTDTGAISATLGIE